MNGIILAILGRLLGAERRFNDRRFNRRAARILRKHELTLPKGYGTGYGTGLPNDFDYTDLELRLLASGLLKPIAGHPLTGRLKTDRVGLNQSTEE